MRGAQEASRSSMGFTEQDHTTDASEVIKKMFTPELETGWTRSSTSMLYRWKSFERSSTSSLDELQAQLDNKNDELEVSDDAKEWLAVNGFDEKMGARPMQRLIQEEIKRNLADFILFGELADSGGIAEVNIEDDKIKITTRPQQESAAASRERTGERADRLTRQLAAPDGYLRNVIRPFDKS